MGNVTYFVISTVKQLHHVKIYLLTLIFYSISAKSLVTVALQSATTGLLVVNGITLPVYGRRSI